jgi:hypothetical protein
LALEGLNDESSHSLRLRSSEAAGTFFPRRISHGVPRVTATSDLDRRHARLGIAQLMRTSWFRAVNVKSKEAQALRGLLAGRKPPEATVGSRGWLVPLR